MNPLLAMLGQMMGSPSQQTYGTEGGVKQPPSPYQGPPGMDKPNAQVNQQFMAQPAAATGGLKGSGIPYQSAGQAGDVKQSPLLQALYGMR
jgi:hypothetical protein